MRQFLVVFLLFFWAAPMTASIIKKPPVKSGEVAYKDIPITEEQKNLIYEIISTVAETGKMRLLFKQDYLKGLGEQINEVHPLKFLETIFSDSHLKMCMLSIWNDYFKRNEFLGGLCPSLDREMDKGKLLMHINDFGTAVGVPGENIRPFFEQRSWEPLVLFLIQS